MSNKIDSIQILRAMAAIFVMLFHYYDSYLASVGHPEHVNYFIFDATGVDLFFIISGFIMFLTTDRNQYNSFTRFFMGRLIRIWPLYFIATIITVGPSLYTLNGLKSMIFYPFMTPNYPVLSQGWTLVYEIYFYLLVSLLIKVKRRIIFLSIYYAFTLLILPEILSLGGNFWDGYITSSNWLHLVISNKNLYFLMGFIIAYLYKKINIKHYISLTIFVVSFVCIGYINYKCIILHGNVFHQPVLFISLILFFIGTIYSFKNYNFNNFCVFLGNSSYSVYLWQYFSIGQAVRIVGVFNIYAFMMGLFLNIVVSYLSYTYIEIRLTNYLRKSSKFVF